MLSKVKKLENFLIMCRFQRVPIIILSQTYQPQMIDHSVCPAGARRVLKAYRVFKSFEQEITQIIFTLSALLELVK